MEYNKEIQKYEQSFLEDLKQLIAIPSLRNDMEARDNAPFGEACREALNLMLKLGKEAGFKVKDYNGYAGVIEFGEGEESVGILGHLDIVPIGVGWSKDPFGCEQHDGYVFGRGVLDDKGPTLAGLYAMKMLKDLNVKLNKKVLLIMGCDEESGMECMDYYVKHGEIPTCGFTPDADFPLIYGEKGILNYRLQSSYNGVIKSMHAGERANIVIGKATLTLHSMSQEEETLFDFYLRSHDLQGRVIRNDNDVTLEMDGVFAHSAYSANGVNAAVHLLNFVGTTYQDEIAKGLHTLLHDWKGSGSNAFVEGAYMGYLTMNAGVVEIKDGNVDVLVDVRYPNDVDAKYVVSKVEQAIETHNLSFKVVEVRDSKPLFVDPKSELIQVLESSYRTYSKDMFTPIKTVGGGTYARKFDNFVAFGPEFPSKEETSFFVGGPHEKDEGMKIEHMMTAIAIYADAIEKLAK